MNTPDHPVREVALEASAGDAVLSLAESPTTGYRWHVVDLPAAVTVVNTEFQVGGAGRPGAGGQRRITLRADAAGTYRFGAKLARAPEDPADERVAVTLVVGDPATGSS